MWNFPATAWPSPFADLARLQRSLFELCLQPAVQVADRLARALHDAGSSLARLPFDLARTQHAAGVLVGAWPRSLLESTRFEQQLGAIERLALGPLARSI